MCRRRCFFQNQLSTLPCWWPCASNDKLSVAMRTSCFPPKVISKCCVASTFADRHWKLVAFICDLHTYQSTSASVPYPLSFFLCSSKPRQEVPMCLFVLSNPASCRKRQALVQIEHSCKHTCQRGSTGIHQARTTLSI